MPTRTMDYCSTACATIHRRRKPELKAGDKIVKIAGHDVKNVYDYTYALGEMKGGQEYEIEVVRGTERLKLKITPESRK